MLRSWMFDAPLRLSASILERTFLRPEVTQVKPELEVALLQQELRFENAGCYIHPRYSTLRYQKVLISRKH